MLGMERRRDITAFKNYDTYKYDHFEHIFSDQLASGLHSVWTNDRWFDFFYQDRGEPVTLVTFTAAAADTNDTYPLFSAQRGAGQYQANLLAFSDAAIGGKESLPTYWHLSTRRVDSQRFIPSIISFAGLGKDLVLFGSSAGGFAALNYGSKFPGSAALVMNPRVNLLNRPQRHPTYTPCVYPGEDPGSIMRRLPYNQAQVYSEPQGNHVVYLQNLQDETYLRNHYAPFERAVRGRTDIEFVTGNWGKGHVVPPRDLYTGILESLIDSAPNWISAPIKNKSLGAS